MYANRSIGFRPSYGRLQELHAFVPPNTPYMACTATVTRDLYKEVIEILEITDCVKICLSPDRCNIFYEVKPRISIESDFSELLDSLHKHQNSTPRAIIYCQSLDMCSNLYAHFHFELGPLSYYPVDSPHISDNRLFGMFHSCTPQYNKELILKSLSVPDGTVRLVFATVALGMGVNFQGVDTIIHYGAPCTLDDYFQESGRGGRSGASAKSTIY